MGDFNAKIGSGNGSISTIVRRLGCGVKKIGELLIELCLTHQLTIGNSIFSHKEIHKIRYNGNPRYQIDHIYVTNRRAADIGRDHQLIAGEFKIKLKC